MILSDLDHLRDNPMVRFKEEVVEDESFTIVSYMIADKDFWKQPLADECRGITFKTDTGECVCRPFNKFFNVEEREDTAPAIVSSAFKECYEKKDGSMIMPIVTKSGMKFKTKKSFYSEVAETANRCATQEVIGLSLVCAGIYHSTPIFEFTHQDHKIVIDYPESQQWTLLAVRDNDSGEYFPYETVRALAESHGCTYIPQIDLTWEEIQRSIENDKGIEGYVLLLKDGRRVKYKTAWYMSLHRTMTELRVRDVAEAVIDETVDDLKSLVSSQGKSLAPIEMIESQVTFELSEIREEVESIAKPLGNLSFKDAAMKLKNDKLFSLVMDKIRGKEPNYIGFWKRNFLKTYSLRVIYNPSFSRDEVS